MPQNLGVYSPKENDLIVKGRTIEGFSEGEFIRIERDDENEFTPRIGAKGDGTFQENPNKSGTFVFLLKQLAPDNIFLQSLKEAKTIFSCEVRSKHGYQELGNGANCMIRVAPRKVMSMEGESDREWRIGALEIVETDKAL